MIDSLNKVLIDLSEPEEQDDLIVEEITRLLSQFKQSVQELEERFNVNLEAKLETKADLSSLQEIHEKLDNYFLKIKERNDSKISELNEVIKSFEGKIADHASVSNNDISKLKTDISDYMKEVDTLYIKTKKEMLEVISDSVKDNKASEKYTRQLLKTLKDDIEGKMKDELMTLAKKLGGGSMPLQISVNGTVANVRYADVNYIASGATVATNNTTHKTDITFPSGGAGTWYQDEIVATGETGTSFTLAHTPSSVVFLYLNGQYLVSGVGYDYTRSGKNITLTNALISSDILTATYS